MARLNRLAAALLCALCIAASTVDATSFLADSLVQSKGSTKAKLSSEYYGYSDTEIACLQELAVKNCRYTGCSDCTSGDDAIPSFTNFFFQTDFTCCPKERGHYGHEDIGVVGFDDKVGTCDWEISIYRWSGDPNAATGFPGGSDVPFPVLTDDNTAIKIGTAWGTCYLNSEAEHCDSPLCERMALSIQGGLYVSCAYGDTQAPTVASTPEGTCAQGGQDGIYSGLLSLLTSQGGIYLNGVCPGFAPPSPPRAAPGAKTPAAPKAPAAAPKAPAPKAPAPKAPAPKGTAKVASEYSETAPTLYAGQAIIISGPFYETSKHDGKIEETGLFEFAPLFSGGTAVGTEPVSKWPVVRAKHAKLRFTREKEEYGREGDRSA